MAATTYPPGTTFFDSLKKSFVDVKPGSDNEIPTSEFLEAAESLTGLFGASKTPPTRCAPRTSGEGSHTTPANSKILEPYVLDIISDNMYE
jgi:hypothetical protein